MIKYVDENGLKVIASILQEKLNRKQNLLVSGINIKTINGESLMMDNQDLKTDITLDGTNPGAQDALSDQEILKAINEAWMA